MGFLIESLFDWFWGGVVVRAREKLPFWLWLPVALSPILIVAALAFLLYLLLF